MANEPCGMKKAKRVSPFKPNTISDRVFNSRVHDNLVFNLANELRKGNPMHILRKKIANAATNNNAELNSSINGRGELVVTVMKKTAILA